MREMDQRTKMRLVSHATSEFIEAHREEFDDLYQTYKAIGPRGEQNTGSSFRSKAISDLKRRYPEEWSRRYYASFT